MAAGLEVGEIPTTTNTRKDIMSVVTSDGQLLRANDGKPPLELVPPEAIWAISGPLDLGRKKYSLRAWERGMPWSVPYACALRHLLKWFQGEDTDEESGLSHIDHAITNLAMLATYERRKLGTDDRPYKVP